MAQIEINGKKIEVELGSMIIEAADTADIWIPRFCYHNKLSIAANCRMCLVDVEKSGKPLPACATPVSDGMKVWTRSPKALQAQKAVMEFLLINHPLDCPICDQGGECELQDISMGYGSDHSRYKLGKRSVKDENIGPLIATNMTRCIQCTRCVRFGSEIAGMRELGATGRGEHMEIGTFIERTVESEVSGNIIDLCPVGALLSKPYLYKARGFELTQKPSLASHDCVGSNLYFHTRRDEVMRVVPRENEAINEIWLSDRDRFSYEALHCERLTQPKIKENGKWKTVGWEEALIKASTHILQANASLGALVSPNSTLEEFYLLQKFIRELGSNNIDHRLRQLDFRDQDKMPIYPHLGTSIAELELKSAIVLIGSDIRAEQPILALKLRKAALAGAKIFVINPVDFPMNFDWTEKIIVEGGDLTGRLASIAKALVQKLNIKAEKTFSDALKEIAVTPLTEKTAKELLEVENTAVILGSLGMHHPEASELIALGNFIAQCIKGNFGVLTDGANGAGAWIAGAVPHRLSGGESLSSPTSSGLNALEMSEKMLKTMIIMNIDPDLDCANGAALCKQLEKTPCVIAITPFESKVLYETADVLLPMCPISENSGTFINTEGSWQSFQPVVTPLGEARPAWKILRVLANLCNLSGFDYMTREEILFELKTSIKKEELEPGDWPRELGSDFEAKLSKPESNRPIRISLVPSYSADNMVRRSKPLQDMQISKNLVTIRLNSALAHKFGILSGEKVEVSVNGNRIRLPAIIDETVPNYSVVIPMGIPETISLGLPYEEVEIHRG